MKKSGWLLCIISLFAGSLQAQVEEDTDSTLVVGLEDVVITGQYSAQSINKSIYQVEVISSEDIKNFAGNNVADVLNQNLNILIVPDQGSGDSQAQILGLGGGYIKILVDNIPLVGDAGVGNNIDLTKINLDNVERIEIVKGAMGVDYGENALAGIINIITKKNIKSRWKINATIQEETVGKEYDWYQGSGTEKGKGRHIQAIDIGHKISDNWFVSVGMNRNDFQGFWGKMKGRNHFIKDSLRGYEWQPKEQWNANGVIRFKSGNFSAFYRAGYLNEKINIYNIVVDQLYLGEGNRTFTSIDTDYFTERWTHHLNLNTKLFGRILYNGDFSYQTQERKSQDYKYDIPNRAILSKGVENVFLSTKSLYSRGTFSNFITRKNLDFQVGYEVDDMKGFANEFAGALGFSDNVEKKLTSFAGFASAEIHTNSGLSFRPGFRASFSNKFDNQYNYSLSSKYNLTSNSSLRAVIGTANRYPNFSELYTNLVDSNHTILGDENLVPEEGYSTSIQWNNSTRTDNFRMNNNISTVYIKVNDRIELVNLTSADFKYLNIDKFESWGISTDHSFWWNELNLNVGASLFGVSKTLLSESYSADNSFQDEFRYNFEANASLNYSVPKWATVFSVYYKYTGKTTEFVKDYDKSTQQNTVYRLGERDDFSLLDTSIRKSFLHNNLEVTVGARNIFDVTSINNTVLAGSGHSASAPLPTQPLFYGRSYFLKINYNLEF